MKKSIVFLISFCLILISFPVGDIKAGIFHKAHRRTQQIPEDDYGDGHPIHPLTSVLPYNKTFISSVVSSQSLKDMNDDQVFNLLSYLASFKIKVLLSDNKDHILSTHYKHLRKIKTKELNGASFLALKIAAEEDEEDLFIRLITLGSDYIIPSLQNGVGDLLSAHLVSKIILSMVKDQEINDLEKKALFIEKRVRYASLLFHYYLEHWCNKDPDKIKMALQFVCKDLAEIAQDLESVLKPEESGRLIGIILSGSFKYVTAIKASDDKRTLIVNSTSNMVWALSTFLGMLPVLPIVSSAIAGGLATTVVAGAIIWDFKKTSRDFAYLVKRFEGRLLLKLQLLLNDQDYSKLKESLDITLLLNGI